MLAITVNLCLCSCDYWVLPFCFQTQKLNVYKNDEMTWDFTAQGLNIPQTSRSLCFEKIAHTFEKHSSQRTYMYVCWCSCSLSFFWGWSEMRDFNSPSPFFHPLFNVHYASCCTHPVLYTGTTCMLTNKPVAHAPRAN